MCCSPWAYTLKGASKYNEFIDLFARQKYLRLGDVEAMLSIEKEEAKAIINQCVRLRMLTMTSGGYRKTPRFKPKSYKTPAGYCLPYLEVSKFLKADTDKIYHGAYVSENGDFKKAVIAFRKYYAIKHRNAKDEMEKYDDFYRSCFKYTTPTGTIMVP